MLKPTYYVMSENSGAITHLVSFCVIRIELINKSEVTGHATGFFYAQKNDAESGVLNLDRLFFVTNRHVIKRTKPDKLRLWIHEINKGKQFEHKDFCIINHGLGDFTNYSWLDIPLYTDTNKPLWKEHPEFKGADVVVIKIDRNNFDENRFFICPFSAISFLPDIFTLYPGEDLVVIGYPFGYFDETHGLPIFKNASIASSYGIPFNGRPYFLIDARLKPGMSGSPVLTKPYNMRVDKDGKLLTSDGTPYSLIGILSSERSFDYNGKEAEPELCVVWYAKLIEDIVKLF